MKVLFHADFFSSELSGFQSQKYFLRRTFWNHENQKNKMKSKKKIVRKKKHKKKEVFFMCENKNERNKK